MSESKGGGGSFEERLRAARQRQGLETPLPEVAGEGRKAPSLLAIGLRVSVELASAVAVGGLIGWWLDRWLGTRPLLLVIFILAGGAAGVLNVWRVVRPGRDGVGG